MSNTFLNNNNNEIVKILINKNNNELFQVIVNYSNGIKK